MQLARKKNSETKLIGLSSHLSRRNRQGYKVTWVYELENND